MSSGKHETPRQRMINMMYLVLTALLALNVSKDILNAFVTVNESIVSTNDNFQKEINELYSEFDQILLIEGESAKPFYEKAQLVKGYTKDIEDYLLDLRHKLVIMGGDGNVTDEMADTISLSNPLFALKDNSEKPTNFFIKEGKASELKNKLAEYKEKVIGVIGDQDNMNKLDLMGLDVNKEYKNMDGKKTSFENYYFEGTVLTADIVIINKFIAEVKAIESQIVNKLMSSVSADDYKFNKIEARVLPKSSFVFKGQPFEAEVLVVAYDTMDNPTIRYKMGRADLSEAELQNAIVVDGDNGRCEFKIGTSTLGEQVLGGRIYVKNPRGEDVSYPFSTTFNVLEQSATVSAEKMNVFYRGLDNPISIAAGLPNDKLNIEVTGGDLKKVNGNFFINPFKVPETYVKIYATVDGKKTLLKEARFRNKNVPSPEVKFSGYNSGSQLYLKDFAAGAKLSTFMRDFDFEGVNYRITGFTISGTTSSGTGESMTINGDALDSQAVNFVKRIRNSILFENIQAVDPTGTTVTLAPISYKLRN